MSKMITTRRVFFKGLLAAGGVAIAAPVASAFRAVSPKGEAGGSASGGFGSEAVLNQMHPIDEMYYETAWAASLSNGGSLTL